MDQSSVAQVMPPLQARKLAKVPFVELAEGRLQGVVSSGSDIERVYVSSIAAGTHDFSCSTNNNRPCGGVYGGGCKHVQSLMDEAILQYGAERVSRYLKLEEGARLNGTYQSVPAAPVFARFLRHLSYLELAGTTEPVPEMHWFPARRRES